MVTVRDGLGEPAVVTPTEEASISVEEKKPPVKEETNKFKLETVDVTPNSEWKESNVENPNENPSTWKAPSEENTIPDPFNKEINELVNKQNQIPWSNCNGYNM